MGGHRLPPEGGENNRYTEQGFFLGNGKAPPLEFTPFRLAVMNINVQECLSNIYIILQH